MPCKEFRIGVFFDGTGNNKVNDLAGRSANGLSNVAKLSDLFPNGTIITGDALKKMNRPITICEIHTQMIYVEGVGTQANQENDMAGNVSGAEGAARINDAIIQVEKALNFKGADEYNQIIDVFGFSRGAAMARDFMNTFIKETKKEKLQFEFGFIGLYDTVGSFGIGGNNLNYKPKDPSEHSEANVDLIAFELGVSQAGSPSRNNFEANFEPYNFNLSAKSAQKITHLVAADEYRTNFPLSNIKGAGFDTKLIGVHSDVGGGYPPISHDTSSFTPNTERRYKGSILTAPFSDYDAEALATADAQRVQQSLGNGWVCEANYNFLGRAKYYNVSCKQERTITDNLQNVGLAAMYNQAKLAGVPLKDFSPPAVPADLQSYAYPTAANPSHAARYSPRQPILDKYAHRSAVDTKETHHHRDAGPHDGIDLFELDDYKVYGADVVGMGMNYDENNKPIRTIFENLPGMAVT